MVSRPWYICDMQQIAISKFKATCLSVLEQVKRTGRPVLVTKFGKPVAEVVPARAAKTARRKLGAMRGTFEILGDIVSPALEPSEWEALR
ncbi:MAG: type II toxin-antitoxin system Phd/YefM family antitoxin [Candidatus Binataceae bacterium]